MAESKQPNFLILWGDDVGQSNLSIFTKGMMGYRTPLATTSVSRTCPLPS